MAIVFLVPLISAVECADQECPITVQLDLTNANVAPTISEEFAVNNITLIALDNKLVEDAFTFVVDDQNGIADINLAGLLVTFTNNPNGDGLYELFFSDCDATPINDTATTIACDVTLPYHTEAGEWTVDYLIADFSNEEAHGIQQTTIINELNYVDQLLVTEIFWSSASVNTNDVEATNYLTLANGGNVGYTNISIKGYDAIGGTYFVVIPATNFSTGGSEGMTTGQTYLVNGTYVQNMDLSLDNGGSETPAPPLDVYFYVDLGALPQDTYLGEDTWSVKVSE
jgi:hypothetical protein